MILQPLKALFACLLVYALPNPQESVTLVLYGDSSSGDSSSSGTSSNDTNSAETQFLVPIGTASGGAQTTYDLIEVGPNTLVSGSVTQTNLKTITGMCIHTSSHANK